MIVRCLATRSTGLTVEPLTVNARGDVVDHSVTPGRDYFVYGLTTYRGYIWYYLLNDDQRDYPIWSPSPLFEVADGAVPAGWRFGQHRGHDGGYFPILSYPEWVDDQHYYEKLVDDEPAAVEAFARWRSYYGDTTPVFSRTRPVG